MLAARHELVNLMYLMSHPTRASVGVCFDLTQTSYAYPYVCDASENQA